MNALVIIILLATIVVAGYIVFGFIFFTKANRKATRKKFKRIQVLYDKFESGRIITVADIYDFAENVLTREPTFQLLQEYNQEQIFPKEFYTIQKAAESNLANWLDFPTELDACPDQIEYLTRITIDLDEENNYFHYEVFRYRINEPHWAAKLGWILGVVGPYFDDSKPYDTPYSTFSRVSSSIVKRSPDEEAKWVHEHISMRRRPSW